jgi:hypothetical protein
MTLLEMGALMSSELVSLRATKARESFEASDRDELERLGRVPPPMGDCVPVAISGH